MNVLSFGEILFDSIEGKNYLGGAPLNFAAHLAQCGANAYMVSSVGADALGAQALQEVTALGVNTAFVAVDPAHPTGTVSVTLRQGQPDYTICEEVAYDYISLPPSEKGLAALPFDILYFGTLAQRHPTSRQALRQLVAQQAFREVFYDVNLRKGFYSRQVVHESLTLCTILKLNDEEVSVLSRLLFDAEMDLEPFARKVAATYHLHVVVITAGAKGCQIFEDDRLNFVPGFFVPVVDTVGAGDAFSAGFIYKYAGGSSAVQAAGIANRLGAFVASSRGPIPFYSPELRVALGLGAASVGTAVEKR